MTVTVLNYQVRHFIVINVRTKVLAKYHTIYLV